MAAKAPILSFLRPLAPPRPATIRHFLRRLESTQAHSKPTEDPNLVASRIAPSSYPPPSLKSLPRPLKSHASHRTSQPTKVRSYPDRLPRDTTPIELLPESESAPNLPYFVTRTRSNELPIYHDSKRGGNLKMTKVKKIDGDVEVLRGELEQLLVGGGGKKGRKEGECVVNKVTGQIEVRGWHKGAVENYLKVRRF